MRNFWNRLKESLARFMQGRHGLDELVFHSLIAGLLLSIIASLTGWGLLSLVGTALYIWSLFRVFSRNDEKRSEENRKYLAWIDGIRTKIRQFINRRKNSKEYKYYHCPQCKALIRVRRGSGERDIHCPKCSKEIHVKA